MSEHTQADFRALVRFALRVAGSCEAELDAIVISNGVFDPVEASELTPTAATDYRAWSNMLRLWADDFLEKTNRLSSAKTKQIVGLPTSGGKAQ